MNQKDKEIDIEVEGQLCVFNDEDAFDARPKKIYSKKMGRPAGKPNLSTREIKKHIRDIIALVPKEQTILDLMNMTPAERQRTLIAYMEFAVAKPQRVVVEGASDEDSEMLVVLPGEIVELIDESEGETD